MKVSLNLCISAFIASTVASPTNDGPDAFPLRRTPLVQSVTTPTSNNPQPSDAGAILYPAIYNTNLTDPHNLDPQVALQIYYEEPGNGSNAAIVAFEDLKHPTVVLEHSSYITNVTCSNSKVKVQFSTRSMALYAFDSWSGELSSGIIFVTNHPTCADSYPAERGWILISTVDKDGASITCDYVDVLVQDIIKTVGIYFGQNTVPSDDPVVINTSSRSSSKTSSELVTSSKTSTTSRSTMLTSSRSSIASEFSINNSNYSSASTSKTTVTNQPGSQPPSSIPSSKSTTHSSSLTVRSSAVTSLSAPKSLTTLTKSQTSSSSRSISVTTSTLHPVSITSRSSILTSTLNSVSASKSSSSKIPSMSASSSFTSRSTTLSAKFTSSTRSNVRSNSNTLSSITSSKPKSSTSSSLYLVTTISTVYTPPSSTSSTLKTLSPAVSLKFTSGSSTVHSTASSNRLGSSSFSSLQSISNKISSSTSFNFKSSSSGSVATTTNHLQSSTSGSSATPQSSSSTLSSKSISLSSTLRSFVQSSSTQFSVSPYSVPSTSGPSASATFQPFVTIADFDTALDDSLGYMNSSAPGFWEQLLPGIMVSQMGGFGTPPFVSGRGLERRDWNLVSIAGVLTGNLPNNVGLALRVVQKTFQTASTAIDAAVSAAIGLAVESLNALSPFTLGPFPFSAEPNNNVTTDFGAGIQLTLNSGTYKGATGNLATYCIGCGVTGTFSVVGTVLFNAEEGITQAVFDLTGSIHAQIELAVIATIAASASEEKNLITQGLPDLTIPGFLVLGPTIALDVGATVSVEALGGLAAGYALDWSSITAHLDILNDDYSATGLLPSGTPIADTELNITSTATLYGLVTLSFGIDVMSGKYKANVGIVDKPEIDAFTEVIVYTDPQIAAMEDGAVICVGENFTLGISDSAYADIVWGGVGTKPISTKTYPLTTWAGPTFTTCFGSLSTIHHTSTASSTISSTPSPSPTVFTGPCDPAPEADGYCCPMPPAWVESPAYTYWYNCIEEAIYKWTVAVDKKCGSNITCYDEIFDPLNTAKVPDCGTDDGSYEWVVCTNDVFWIFDKLGAIQYQATWGKRGLEDRKKQYMESKRGIKERQSGFVNIFGHGTRNSSTMLAWSQDGNLVASQNGTLFATLDGNVIGDTNGRFLHYYEQWMNNAEISRLRLASLDMMPVGSVLVSLAPMDVGLATPSLVAFTSSGAYYYIITCTITGQLPKLFLAREVNLGLEELMQPGVQNTLTGGVVEECGLLPWSV